MWTAAAKPELSCWIVDGTIGVYEDGAIKIQSANWIYMVGHPFGYSVLACALFAFPRFHALPQWLNHSVPWIEIKPPSNNKSSSQTSPLPHTKLFVCIEKTHRRPFPSQLKRCSRRTAWGNQSIAIMPFSPRLAKRLFYISINTWVFRLIVLWWDQVNFMNNACVVGFRSGQEMVASKIAGTRQRFFF